MPHIQPDPTPPYDVTAVTAAADRAVEASGVGLAVRTADGFVQVVFPQSTPNDRVNALWAELTGHDLVSEFDYIADDLAALIVVEGPEIGPIGDIDGGGDLDTAVIELVDMTVPCDIGGA